MTLKEYVTKAAELYESRAEWETKRAEQATNGSNIQREISQASAYNRGRAAAMREVLDIIDNIIG